MRRLIALLLVLAALGALPAAAQPMPFHGSDAGWSFALTPYFWAAGVNGTVTTPFERLPRREVSADFDTVFNDINGFVGMLSAEARKDRLALVGDVVTIALGADFASPHNAFFPGGRGDLDLTFATVATMFRVVRDDRFVLDLGAGMRAWWASTSLALNSGVLPGRTVGASATWADPIVSARGMLRLSERFSLSAYGDAGGFGVGSDISWQVAGTLDWLPAPWVALRAGWRYLVVDRPSQELSIDVSMSGPVFAATFRF